MKFYEKNSFWKRQEQQQYKEEKAGAFRCAHCHAFVVVNEYIGTKNRNHCNLCLWSKHVDIQKGDRAAVCQGGMEPIGLTLKREGISRYGELMLIHICKSCEKVSINRIAADDSTSEIMRVFEESQKGSYLSKVLEEQGIYLLTEDDSQELKTQLFGR